MKRSYSQNELQDIAKEVLSLVSKNSSSATVLALSGELGAGKTSLVQAIARELGINENVVSPTFVIAKWYGTASPEFKKLVHIDAYRIEDESELGPLGIEVILKDPDTLLVVEWPSKINQTLVDAKAILFKLSYEGNIRNIEGPTLYEGK